MVNFKIYRMRKLLLVVFCFWSMWAFGDHLLVNGDVKVVSVADGFAELEVQLSWSNSWRNSCNYDAVYIFGKYRLPDSDEKWHHLFFDASDDVHSVGSGYGLSVMNGGRGCLCTVQRMARASRL